MVQFINAEMCDFVNRIAQGKFKAARRIYQETDSCKLHKMIWDSDTFKRPVLLLGDLSA